MKNNKWLNYTLGILLTLVVLVVAAGAGFRTGMMQNASFARPAFAHNFDGGPQAMRGNQPGNSQNNDGQQSMQGNFHDNGGPQSMQGNSRNKGFDDNRGGMNFRSPLFGLIHVALLGLLGWFGYTLVKKSGWRITRVAATESAAAAAPVVDVEEKKESE